MRDSLPARVRQGYSSVCGRCSSSTPLRKVAWALSASTLDGKVRVQSNALLRSAFEQIVHFLVRRLREILVPVADGSEWIRRACAEDLIGFLLHLAASFHGADGDSDDDLCRLLPPQGRDGGAHGRSRGKAVIDENDDAAMDIGWRTLAAINPLAPLQLLQLIGGNLLDDFFGNAECPYDIPVQDTHAT